MADSANTEEDEEYNVPEETSSTVNSTIDTSSTDTNAVLVRNRLLRNTMKELNKTFHVYKDTMEELIEKPVVILEKQTFNDISANKDTLKKSEEILKQAVLLLKEGVKTMKEAMIEHSRKIEELCNFEECSKNYSNEDLPKDCHTLKKGSGKTLESCLILLKCADKSDFLHFKYRQTGQDFTGNQDGLAKNSHEEDYMYFDNQNLVKCCVCQGKILEDKRRNHRALASIRSSQSEAYGFIDIIRRPETVMGSPYSRYSAFGTPLNPITSITPNSSVESGQILMVGNRWLPSNFGISSSDRPGTSNTRTRRMSGKHDNFHSRRLSQLSFNLHEHDMSSQNERRGKGMILKGSRSDLRPRTDVGPRRMPDDKKM